MGTDGTTFQEGDEMSKSVMEPHGAYECYNCGDTRNPEEHHIFYGQRNRKLSEHYGLKVHLCPGCHRNLKTGVHGGNRELDKRLKDRNYLRRSMDMPFLCKRLAKTIWEINQ